MMREFSPFIRRVLAIGILLLFLLCAIEFIIIPINGKVGSSRDTLADSRFEVSRLQSIIGRPDPPSGKTLDPSSLLKAEDHENAQNALQALLANLAAQNNIEVTTLFGVDDKHLTGLIRADVSVSGDEISIINFLTQIENNQILMRMINWNIEYDEDIPHHIKFNSQLLAVWEKQS